MTIRRATLHDLNEIRALDVISWPETERPLSEQQWQERLKGRDLCFLSLDESKVVGVILTEQLTFEPYNFEIDRLFVHPEHRKNGHARNLTQVILNIANQDKKKTFAAANSAHTGAKDFYLRLGFVEDEIVPCGNGSVYHGMTYTPDGVRL